MILSGMVGDGTEVPAPRVPGAAALFSVFVSDCPGVLVLRAQVGLDGDKLCA